MVVRFVVFRSSLPLALSLLLPLLRRRLSLVQVRRYHRHPQPSLCLRMMRSVLCCRVTMPRYVFMPLLMAPLRRRRLVPRQTALRAVRLPFRR